MLRINFIFPIQLLSIKIYGFILGRVYGARCPICPSDDKILPCCLLILTELPNAEKYVLAKKKFKIELCSLLKFSSQQTNFIKCVLWQFSKSQKRKQSSDWYDLDDRTPVHYIAPF